MCQRPLRHADACHLPRSAGEDSDCLLAASLDCIHYAALMPAFDLCIFDFDGTLADSFPWFCSILDQTSARFGLNRVKPEDIPALRDLPTREVLQHLGVPYIKLPAIATFMRALAVEATAHI